jgi:hypothetical protein
MQLAVAQALLAQETAARTVPAAWFDGNAERGLRVHRNTIVGACCAALRLSYPTLERVLGAPMFEALAANFARAHPPAAPALDEYGAAFGAFVAARAGVADRALLHELATFDWHCERVAHCAPALFSTQSAAHLEGGVRLYLHASLRLVDTHFAVENMRADAAASIEQGALRTLALWRCDEGVAVAALSAPAATFVAGLLHGMALEQALAAAGAAGGCDEVAVAAVLARDVLQSAFARLTPGDAEHGNRTEH